MFNQISTVTIGKVHVVTLNAKRIMDPIMIDEIGDELASLINDHPGDSILLDLQNVEFLSSAVLNRLIVLDKSVKSNRGVMALCGLNPAVAEVMSITKLDLLFRIFSDREEGLKELE